MVSKITVDALAEFGLSPIPDLPGHDDANVNRRAALSMLRKARRLRDRRASQPPDIEVLFLVGANPPEVKVRPDVSLVIGSAVERTKFPSPRCGYPVAWIRGYGVRDDGTSYTYVDISWPDKHRGDSLDHRGNVAGPLHTAVPRQVEIALARRHREARHALGRIGGPLEGLVDARGELVAAVDDDHFDNATIELWQRHLSGEWVGQMSSMLFFVHVGAQVCGRDERDLNDALARLDRKQLANANGMTLVPWLPPLDDDRPTALVDSIDLVDRRVEIYLPDERRERRSWRITKVDNAGNVEHEELLDLSHDPVFGPDVTDVWQLEERLEQMLGPDYPQDRPRRPAG